MSFVSQGSASLSPEQLEAFGREIDAVRDRVLQDLGERDARYIRRLIAVQRRLEVAGRTLLFASAIPGCWPLGTLALGLAKILDNMEIGHNVMHGQYDFLKDPALDGNQFEWDATVPASQWRHTHNYVHHTFTNIIGKDRDIGYGVLRMTDAEPWRPTHLFQPLYALLLAIFFEWGVSLHDMQLDLVAKGQSSPARAREKAVEVWKKARRQILKDYVIFPVLAGPWALPVLAGNLSANIIRNIWAFTVIFCGHFTDDAKMFSEDEVQGETRAAWYLRQVLGSSNFHGSRLMHLMSGNLSYQIEHHLFPGLPAHRYQEIAGEIEDICRRYGVGYHTGSLASQFLTVVRRIGRLSLPAVVFRAPSPIPGK